MSDAATPTENNGGTPPATPVATPAPVEAPKAPTAANPELVTLTKEQHDQLARDAARASANQRKADLYDRLNGANSNSRFKPVAPTTPPTEDERAAQALVEDRKAERGLLALAADPAYREVLDLDPTLRSLLTTYPLAVLPLLAPDALDADDALNLVKEALNARKPVAPPAKTPAPSTPPTPPAGAINPNDSPVNDEVEAARKDPNTENAIAKMVGARLGGLKK